MGSVSTKLESFDVVVQNQYPLQEDEDNEMTYNGNENEVYFDAYKKWKNKKIVL